MNHSDSIQVRIGTTRLEEIVAEIELKSRELQGIASTVDNKTAERGQLESEIHSRKNEILFLERQINDLSKAKIDLEKTVEGFKTIVNESRKNLEWLETVIPWQKERIEENYLKIDSIHASIIELMQRENDIQQNLKRNMDKIVRLEGKERECLKEVEFYKREVRIAVEEKQRVEDSITEALENFKVFEKRIAQLSEETGYQVGHKEIHHGSI